MTRALILPLATLIAVGLLSAAGTAPAFADDPSSTTKTPIKHFISLMQENHSFDNYFGTYPGADGFPKDLCMPVDPGKANGKCVKPYHIAGRSIVDLGHNVDTFKAEYLNGNMDGFISAFNGQRGAGDEALGYYDDRDMPYYWNVADNYVLFDRFFTSAAGGSVWNHFYWVSATPGNPKDDQLLKTGFDAVPTIFDALQAAGISWKFYIQNYNPDITFRSPGTTQQAAQVVFCPLLNYNRFLDNPELSSHIQDLDEYFKDLHDGTLPAVSFIVPSGSSEHPPSNIQAGERFVRSLIGALMTSSSWDSSAFMWSYDDWGGWYDHVKPPKVDAYGLGFRAPALLVSPYARQGYVDSTVLDFTSMLKFIEDNWGVQPLSTRDAQANNITTAFDFNSPPRHAALLSENRQPPPPPPTLRQIVFTTYGGAAVIPAALILIGGLGVVFRRRVRPRIRKVTS
jgi:phospholipase C